MFTRLEQCALIDIVFHCTDFVVIFTTINNSKKECICEKPKKLLWSYNYISHNECKTQRLGISSLYAAGFA